MPRWNNTKNQYFWLTAFNVVTAEVSHHSEYFTNKYNCIIIIIFQSDTYFYKYKDIRKMCTFAENDQTGDLYREIVFFSFYNVKIIL